VARFDLISNQIDRLSNSFFTFRRINAPQSLNPILKAYLHRVQFLKRAQPSGFGKQPGSRTFELRPRYLFSPRTHSQARLLRTTVKSRKQTKSRSFAHSLQFLTAISLNVLSARSWLSLAMKAAVLLQRLHLLKTCHFAYSPRRSNKLRPNCSLSNSVKAKTKR